VSLTCRAALLERIPRVGRRQGSAHHPYMMEQFGLVTVVSDHTFGNYGKAHTFLHEIIGKKLSQDIKQNFPVTMSLIK
jgi:hypothetical protein